MTAFLRCLLPVAAAALLAGPPPAAQAATVTISCGSVGQDLEFCKSATEAWAAQTGHTVKLYIPPQSTTDILAQFRQMFSQRSPEVDVLAIDVVWPGLLKEHLIDLRPHSRGAEKEHFPAIVANNTVDGKLLAMPWFTDAGLLYYRRDLLDKYGEKRPDTWEQMAATAARIQEAERRAGRTAMQGYVFQGKAYEGLTCNLMEWLHSHGAGSGVEPDGRISVASPKAVQALRMAAGWVGTIAPKEVLNYAEEDARAVFQNGNAVFMRNWPYAWALLNAKGSKVAMRVGVTALPKGGASGQRSATLGGWQLAVSKYSREPQVAAELVMHLTSQAVQRDRAIRGAYNPTRPALYQDTEVLFAAPFLAILQNVFLNATPRPSTVTGARYADTSAALWTTTHQVLSGKASAEDGLRQLDTRLQQLRGAGW